MIRRMALHLTVVLVLLSLLACTVPVSSAVVVPADFSGRLDGFIRCLLSDRSHIPLDLRTPELSIAVVANSQVVFTAGYGHTSNNTPITADTLFGVGSISKAFTSTAAGILADQGKLMLAEPISRHASWRTYDAYVTRETSLRDLFTHHTGISRNDFVFACHSTDSDWRAMLKQYVPLLPPSLPFRAAYLYNNWMIAQAALVIETIIQTPWSEYITSMLLQPLGMANTTTTYAESLTRNRATPYTAGPSSGVAPLELPTEADAWADLVAPAGAIHSTANDMSKWLLFHLGSHPQLINQSTLDFLHSAEVTSTPPTGRFASRGYVTALNPNLSVVAVGYGYNWVELVWNGHAAVEHNGALWGFISDLWFFPLDGFGWWIGTPAVSSEYFDLLAVWIVAEMLGQYNVADGLCRPENSATENAARWDEVRDTLEPLFAQMNERRREHSSGPPQQADTATSSSHSVEPTSDLPLHAVDPSQLIGTYTDLVGPFGVVNVSLNGDNSTYPLLLTWEAARMLLTPAGRVDPNIYDALTLAPTAFALLYTRLFGVAHFDVDARGAVRGLRFYLGSPVPYLTSAAYAANISSSSTGANQLPLLSSSTGDNPGASSGAVVERDKTVELVIVLCIVSVVLLVVVSYALLITKRYRELSGAGGSGSVGSAGSTGGSLRESLLST